MCLPVVTEPPFLTVSATRFPKLEDTETGGGSGLSITQLQKQAQITPFPSPLSFYSDTRVTHAKLRDNTFIFSPQTRLKLT